ncbi:hypothetical protein MNBD_GAMMA03-673 [hydrothermal vent metagenome]|uniref:TraD/TraG TraM recognition site domain-containing protein n=1 Tax=hydrothermal vent metagenome TaxID=652676 RepID=A0A3B0VWL9_9ZZZZ
MNKDFYRQYAYGSTQLATEQDAQILSKGTGPIARLGNTIIRFRPQEPCIIFGGAGSGKGANLGIYQFVHPTTGSFFTLDNSGQSFSTTWHWNVKANREVYAINAQGCGAYPEINHPVNLWGILKDDENLFEFAELIAEMSLTESDSKGENAWVGENAQRWVSGIFMVLVLINGRVTPESFWELVNQFDSGDDEVFKTWARSAEGMPHNIYSTLVEILRKKHGSEKEYGAIMGKIKSNFNYLSSRKVAQSLSGDVDYLEFLGDPNKKVGIYLIIRAGSAKAQKSLICQAIGIAQLHCIRANKGAKPLFYIEEANTCGAAECIKEGVSQFRKFFFTVLVYQSHGQLTHLFGASGAQEIMDSCGMQIYLGGGIRDPKSARRLSDAIGKTTIYIDNPMEQADRRFKAEAIMKKVLFEGEDPIEAAKIYQHEISQSYQQKQIGRDAIDPAELMRFQNEVVILTPSLGLDPIVAQKLPFYWLNRAMAGRYAPDPLHPPLDSVTIQRRYFGSTTRRFIRQPVPEHLAHMPNHISGEIFYVQGFKTW